MAQKVLIVDDDKLLSNSQASALEAAGFQTLVAYNGKDGVETALREHPDIILLDYQMPVMDGIEALTAIRADQWGKSAKVIFSTNTYDVAIINAVLTLDVPDYILKADTSLEEIVALIHTQLGE